MIQAMAAEAGFDMKIRVTEFATSLKRGGAGRVSGVPDRLGGPHRSGRQHLYLPQDQGAAEHYSGFSSPDVDQALDESRLTADPAKRKAIYEKAAKVLLTEDPIIYLYHRKVLIAHTAQARGLQGSARRSRARGGIAAEMTIFLHPSPAGGGSLARSARRVG